MAPSSGTGPASSTAVAGYIAAQQQADLRLEQRLLDQGWEILPNGGGGRGLCLTISLLQAAGQHVDPWGAPVRQLFDTLAGGHDALAADIGRQQGLHGDRETIRDLSASLFGAGRMPPLYIVTTGPEGRPLLYEPMEAMANQPFDPAAVPENSLVIFETHRYFSALLNRSGRPLAAALSRLLQPDTPSTRAPSITETDNSPEPPAPPSQLLRERAIDSCLTLVPDADGGAHLNLPVALMRWAGVPVRVAETRARDLHATLATSAGAFGDALRAGTPLHADPAGLAALVRGLFTDPALLPPLFIATPDEHGALVLHDPWSPRAVTPEQVPHHALVFMERPDRSLQALANTGDLPWPMALSRMQVASGRPEPERHLEWMRHVIRSARNVDCRVADPDGQARSVHFRVGAIKKLDAADDLPDAPIEQSRQRANLHDAVDRFWAAVATHGAIEIRSPISFDEERHVHVLATRGPAGAGGPQADYTGSLHVRQGRVTRLVLSLPDGSGATVEFDHPWARPKLSLAHHRALLRHVDDVRVFDEMTWRPELHRAPHDLHNLAEFLVQLRSDHATLGWEGFLRWPDADRAHYLNSPQWPRHVAATIRRLLAPRAPEAKRARNVPRERLHHEEDLAAYDTFAQRDPSTKRPGDENQLSHFLAALRADWPGMGSLPGFGRLKPERRWEIYATLAREGKLSMSAVAPVERALQTSCDPVLAWDSRSGLDHPDDLDTYDEKTWVADREVAAENRLALPPFLRRLRSQAMGWDEFEATPEPERAGILNCAQPGQRSVLKRLLNPGLKRKQRVKSENKLHHPDDLAFLKAYDAGQHALPTRCPKSAVASFLADLRAQFPELGIGGFAAWPIQARQQYSASRIQAGALTDWEVRGGRAAVQFVQLHANPRAGPRADAAG